MSVADSDRDWTTDGRCYGHRDPDLFFAEGRARQRQALALCAACPVREACLFYALDHGIDFGVWGGLTAEQRRQVAERIESAAAA